MCYPYSAGSRFRVQAGVRPISGEAWCGRFEADVKDATAVFAATFREPDDMAAALRCVAVDYLSTRRSPGVVPYEASLAVVQFGRITIQHADDDAHIASGEVARDSAVLLLPIDGTVAGLAVNAYRAGPTDAVLFSPGAELRTVCPGRQAWAAVSISGYDAVTEWADLPAEGCFAALPGFLGRDPSFVSQLIELGWLARHDRARLAEGSVPEALAEQWASALARALGAALPASRASSGPGRMLHRRVRLVAAAEEKLAGEIGRPIYSDGFAASLGVSVRTLHDAFQAVFGMGVQSYLQNRRLHLVRAALRRGAGRSDLVKEVALRFGFWHLGRFAQAYQVAFGELPSATLAAAISRRGAVARASAAD